jgi:hypothetical protein
MKYDPYGYQHRRGGCQRQSPLPFGRVSICHIDPAS